MKKILFLFLIACSFVSIAQQKTDQTLITQGNTISNAGPGQNTNVRIGGYYNDLVNSKLSVIPLSASGTNTYIAASSVVTSYSNGLFQIVFQNGNTGASTLNINSLGTVNLQKLVSGSYTALSSGDIQNNQRLDVWYDQPNNTFQIFLGGGTPTPTANTNAQWDANKNMSANSFLYAGTSAATANTTTTLTVGSTYLQLFTGSTTGQIVQMPVTSTLALYQTFKIANRSSVAITINSSGANLIGTVAAGADALLTCILTSGTTAASWDFYSSSVGVTITSISGVTSLTGSAFGTILNCSGTSANYNITLPAPSGNSGLSIAFKGDAALTRFITVLPNASETIDGSSSKVFWSGEFFVLVCDGTNWKVTTNTRKALTAWMVINANQTSIVTNTLTKVSLNTVQNDNSTRMGNTGSSRIDIQRTGWYDVSGTAIFNSISAATTRAFITFYINGIANNSIETSGYASGTYPSPRGTFPILLNAGDYVELYCFHLCGSNQTIIGTATGSSTYLRVTEILY